MNPVLIFPYLMNPKLSPQGQNSYQKRIQLPQLDNLVGSLSRAFVVKCNNMRCRDLWGSRSSKF